MMFQTPPDFFDGHTHMVEVDDQGNGLTDENGNPPHTHEVMFGAANTFATPDYVSQHPGELMEPDSGAPPQAGAPTSDPGSSPDMGGQPGGGPPPPPYEQVQAAIGMLMEGEGRISAMAIARAIYSTY